ncbi:MAG TPA: cohesin domain-containing protein, partial [Telluria sp.]
PAAGGAVVSPIAAPALLPAGGAAAGAAVAGPGGVALSWQGPAQVKVGEQFSAVVRLNSQQALRGLPALLGFDPQLFQVVNVQEGDYFKQANGKTSFSERVDAAAGKLFVAAVRQSGSGVEPGVNGSGTLVSVTFKAIKAAPAARLQLLSASPEPAPTLPLVLPVEHLMRVTP